MDFFMIDSIIIDLLSMIAVSGAITGFHTADAGSGDTTGTGNLDEVIPEMWSTTMMGYFEAKLGLAKMFNDFSDLVKGAGDTVNIPEIPESTGLADKSAGASVLYQDEDMVKDQLTKYYTNFLRQNHNLGVKNRPMTPEEDPNEFA